jgi:uncharacterized protein (DUF952 family)
MPLIFHITQKTVWENAIFEGQYISDTLESQCFIHCSTQEQLFSIANFIFRGKTGLVLIVIDESLVQAEIRYENLEGGTDLFPHIYGHLNLDAIIRVIDFSPGKDSTFELPEEIDCLLKNLAG